MSNYTEREIGDIAYGEICKQPGICTTELIAKTRAIMKPSGDDLTILDGRNDDKFSQKVRNLKSHNSMPGAVRTVGERNRKWFPIS